MSVLCGLLSALAVAFGGAVNDGDWKSLADDLLSRSDVPGLALAVISEGQVSSAGFGVRDFKGGEPVDATTVFEAASLTKPVVAYSVLQLVDAGKLDLDRPLEEYWKYPDLDGDRHGSAITARRVLSHSTGLPNWRQGRPLRTEFEPGARFQYSGEGFVYLARVVEHITSQPLEAYVKKVVFEPLGMSRSSLIWEARFADNFAPGHRNSGVVYPREERSEANAAASLLTTAEDFSRFLAALVAGEGLSAERFGELATPQVSVAAGVSWGLGFGIEQSDAGVGLWQWGHNSGYRAFMLIRRDSGRAAVIFTNSDRGMTIIPSLLAEVMGGSQPAFGHLGYDSIEAPGWVVYHELKTAFLEQGADAGCARLQQLHAEHGDAALDHPPVLGLGAKLLAEGHPREAAALDIALAEARPRQAHLLARAAEANIRAGDVVAAADAMRRLGERMAPARSLGVLERWRQAGGATPLNEATRRKLTVEARVAALMLQHQVPGASVAVVQDHELAWAEGFGVLKQGEVQAVDKRSLFQAASISKPVAAFGALRLIERGELELDGEVNDLLLSWQIPDSELTETREVTPRMLLSHTAGLTVHGFPGYDSRIDPAHLLDVLDGVSPANTPAVQVDLLPGTQFRYSGGGFSVLQLLMTDLVDQEFPELMHEWVLGPAQMTESTYAQPLPGDREANACHGHRGTRAPVPGRWHVYPEMAAAGLWTTPTDLCRFAMEVMRAWKGDSELLTRDMAREMLTQQVDPSIGLGLMLEEREGVKLFHHGGSNDGFKCFLAAIPATGQAAVVMTNADSGSAMLDEVIEIMAELYSWPLTHTNG